MNLQTAFETTCLQLQQSGLPAQEAAQETWWFLESLLQKSKATIVSNYHNELSQEQEQRLATMIHERTMLHKPLQYIIGNIPFCSLTISVEPPILIPRPETEEWCTVLIERLKKLPFEFQKKLRILDMCTGSGCIALALAHALKEATVLGVDKNAKAIELAEENRENNNLTNIMFLESDLFEKIAPPFSLIISNPPYISEKEWQKLSIDVKKWEDHEALVASNNGLAFYQAIIEQAESFISCSLPLHKYQIPRLVFEIAEHQVADVTSLLQKHSYSDIEVFYDLAKKPRAIFAYMPPFR